MKKRCLRVLLHSTEGRNALTGIAPSVFVHSLLTVRLFAYPKEPNRQ